MVLKFDIIFNNVVERELFEPIPYIYAIWTSIWRIWNLSLTTIDNNIHKDIIFTIIEKVS